MSDRKEPTEFVWCCGVTECERCGEWFLSPDDVHLDSTDDGDGGEVFLHLCELCDTTSEGF